MKFKVCTRTLYHCTLEQAFKTPMLSDITKVHTGFGIMPRVTHCKDDTNWGKPGGSKRIFVAKSWTQKAGESSIDTVLERIENKYWKIQVSDFKMWMLGFTKFVGEWKTTETEPNKVEIEYCYTLHASRFYWYPLNWLFAKLIWRIYMKRVLKNIRIMIENKEPYLYE